MNHTCSSFAHVLCLIVIGLLLLDATVAKRKRTIEIPRSHRINVPYHMQLTDYGCGDASVEMVMDYYGTDEQQYSIMQVMRTTQDEGTYSWDVVRAAHFSVLSASQGVLWPDYSLSHGYPNRTMGMAAFYYDDQQDWLDEVKGLIAMDIPVIVLMHFLPNGTNDGHFRVVVGYDDTQQQIIMNDPWNRDGYPPIAVWSYSDFLNAWHYFEPNSTRTNPYFGVAFLEWEIEASTQLKQLKQQGREVATVEARVNYPCPPPFDCSAFPASNVLISLEFGEQLGNGVDFISPSSSVYLGKLKAGEIGSGSWVISCTPSCSQMTAKITASGMVHGSLPDTYLNNLHSYPAYFYHDIIGSQLNYTLS